MISILLFCIFCLLQGETFAQSMDPDDCSFADRKCECLQKEADVLLASRFTREYDHRETCGKLAGALECYDNWLNQCWNITDTENYFVDLRATKQLCHTSEFRKAILDEHAECLQEIDNSRGCGYNMNIFLSYYYENFPKSRCSAFLCYANCFQYGLMYSQSQKCTKETRNFLMKHYYLLFGVKINEHCWNLSWMSRSSMSQQKNQKEIAAEDGKMEMLKEMEFQEDFMEEARSPQDHFMKSMQRQY